MDYNKKIINIIQKSQNNNDIILHNNINKELIELTDKYNELTNKINFIKKNVNSDKITNLISTNLISLKNNIINSINDIDEQIIMLAHINKKSTIEIEFS